MVSSNKGLSGGVVTQPIEDTVQEFQQLTLNMSAQYGNSAGSVTNLVTKSGTNDYHGSGWWFNRNDWFDANTFFGNQSRNASSSTALQPVWRNVRWPDHQGQAVLLLVLPSRAISASLHRQL